MSDAIGLVTVLNDQGQLSFPGTSEISAEAQRLVDEEVRRMSDGAHTEVRQLLESHRDKLDALASALLEHETLGQDEAYSATGLAPAHEHDGPDRVPTVPEPHGATAKPQFATIVRSDRPGAAINRARRSTPLAVASGGV